MALEEVLAQARSLIQRKFGDPSSPTFNLRWRCSNCGGRKGPKKTDPLGQRYCCGLPMIPYEKKDPSNHPSSYRKKR